MRYVLAFIMFLIFSDISSGSTINQGEMVVIGSKNAGYIMYTPVFIDGVAHLAFIDTGSARSAVYRSVSHKRDVIDSINSHGLFSAEKTEITLARTISFPGSTHTNSTVSIKSDPHADLRLPIKASALIGADILGKKPLLLDFSNEVIKHVDIADASSSTFINARFINNLPFIDISLHGKKCSALIDTGATISAIDEKFVNAESSISTISEVPSEVSDTFGVTRISSVRVLEVAVHPESKVRARFAKVDLSNVSDVVGLDIDIILGMDFISQYDWLIDFPSQRIVILNAAK